MAAKDYVIDETEWWDRAAVAVDMLLKKEGVRRRETQAGGRAVRVYTNVPAAGDISADPGRTAEPDVTAYLFQGLRDAEILRRLNQMPDETPLDLLMAAFAIYCPEMKSFISVNDPAVPLEEHLKKMDAAKGAS